MPIVKIALKRMLNLRFTGLPIYTKSDILKHIFLLYIPQVEYIENTKEFTQFSKEGYCYNELWSWGYLYLKFHQFVFMSILIGFPFTFYSYDFVISNVVFNCAAVLAQGSPICSSAP